MRDFYSVLEIKYPSSMEEIKSAYKRLAKKYHPDLNGGASWAEEKFKEIQEAYSILSDSYEKIEYDKKYVVASAVHTVTAESRTHTTSHSGSQLNKAYGQYRPEYSSRPAPSSNSGGLLAYLIVGLLFCFVVYLYALWADSRRYWIDSNGVTHIEGCKYFHQGEGKYSARLSGLRCESCLPLSRREMEEKEAIKEKEKREKARREQEEILKRNFEKYNVR